MHFLTHEEERRLGVQYNSWSPGQPCQHHSIHNNDINDVIGKIHTISDRQFIIDSLLY